MSEPAVHLTSEDARLRPRPRGHADSAPLGSRFPGQTLQGDAFGLAASRHARFPAVVASVLCLCPTFVHAFGRHVRGFGDTGP